MLREPKKAEHTVQVRKDKKSGRFQFVKLEERIAAGGPHQPARQEGGRRTHPWCLISGGDRGTGRCAPSRAARVLDVVKS